MKITFLGHACFRIDSGLDALIVDPYEPNYVPGYAPLNETAQQVFCTHQHQDHHGISQVRIVRHTSPNPFTVTSLKTWHDDQQGALRGENTIFIIEAEGFRVVHLGDLGCELTEDQLAQIHGCSVLLIPVGGHYTIDARQANELANAVQARITIPMHYRGPGFGYDVIGTVDEFADLRDPVVFSAGSDIVLTGQEPRGTVVLTPKYLMR